MASEDLMQAAGGGQFLAVPGPVARRPTRTSKSSQNSLTGAADRKPSRKISRALSGKWRKTSARLRLGRSSSQKEETTPSEDVMPRKFLRQDSVLIKVKPGQHFADGAEIMVESPSKTDPNLGTLGELRHHLRTGSEEQVKKFLRNNHWSSGNRIRSELWKELCRDAEIGARMVVYRDTIAKLTRHSTTNLKPSFVTASSCVEDVVFCDHQLKSTGKASLLRILTAVEHLRPDFTYIPILYPLGAMMLHYMSEEETFCCIMNLLNQRQIFLLQTDIATTASKRTLLQLVKKHRSGVYNQMKRLLPASDDDQHLITVFKEWKGWIFRDLPFFHAVRVVDCFLYEGHKVLFRVAISILDYWSKSGRQRTKTVSDPSASQQNASSVASDISQFCKAMPVQPDKLLKTAFGIRNLKTATIRRLQERHELIARKQDGTLARVASQHSFDKQTPRYTEFQFDSRIIDASQNVSLMSWLPPRMQLFEPRKLFSQHQDGTSFTRLWQNIDGYTPTIFIIQTENDEVLGFYSSNDWAERNSRERTKSKYFGTGESFVFVLNSTESKRFAWIGKNKVKVEHNEELFQAAHNDWFMMGGGAISIRDDLTRGVSEASLTFDTAPLTEGGCFDVKEMEVHGFIMDEE